MIHRCPDCRRPLPSDPAVRAHGQERPHFDARCLCNDYCFEIGDHYCVNACEILEYQARLCKMPLDEFLVFNEGEQPDEPGALRAAADPRWGDCPNCNRPVHLPSERGGCQRGMRCAGFTAERMAQLAVLDKLEVPGE